MNKKISPISHMCTNIIKKIEKKIFVLDNNNQNRIFFFAEAEERRKKDYDFQF